MAKGGNNEERGSGNWQSGKTKEGHNTGQKGPRRPPRLSTRAPRQLRIAAGRPKMAAGRVTRPPIRLNSDPRSHPQRFDKQHIHSLMSFRAVFSSRRFEFSTLQTGERTRDRRKTDQKTPKWAQRSPMLGLLSLRMKKRL
eukprot:3964312-Pyramimonas_sp.AAC.1